jgi:hypothetical protein
MFLHDFNSTANALAAEYLAAHEYGHNLGLSHAPRSLPGFWGEEAVNVGRYDLMRASAGGGFLNEGILPYHPIQLVNLGWLPESTLAVTDVADVRIPDILGANRRVFRIPTPDPTEYFLLANHQGNTGFDAKYVGTGLFVWHVLRSPGNDLERAWDLESAVGKFTGGVRDPVAGEDSLEADSTYAGSGNDFMTSLGVSCGTNPGTALHSGELWSSDQSDTTSIGIENVRQDSNGDILVDVFFTPKQGLTHPLAGDTVSVELPNTITWATRDSACIDTVVGLLSDDGGSSFDTLFVDLANSGSYSWTPTAIDSEYVVRLVSHDKTGGTGTSESGIFRVADRVAPSNVTNLLVEFVSQTSVGLTWTAPGDDSTSGTATEYDIRRSTSPITVGNWHLATKLTNEDPPDGAGEEEMLWVQNLSSCTTYYFAIKTRDESHNWSALGTAEGQSTMCGGGFAAGPVSDERSAVPTALTSMPQDQLVLDLTSVDGAPSWTLTDYDHVGLDEGSQLPGGIHVQVPDGRGGWQSRAHFATLGSDSLIGTCQRH